MNENKPKVLIVTDAAWEDDNNIGNTLSNIFSGWSPQNLALVYGKPNLPNTDKCSNFFQISESRLFKRLFNRKIITGKVVSSISDISEEKDSDKILREESIGKSYYHFFKKIRLNIFLLLREVLWNSKYWKTEELDSFVKEFDPDMLFFIAKDFIYVNKIQQYVSEVANVPSTLYFVDDVYTKSRFSFSPVFWFHNYLIRRSIRRTVRNTDYFYAISNKMKDKYSKDLNIDIELLTKGASEDDMKNLFSSSIYHFNENTNLLYSGNFYDGRWKTLMLLGDTIKKYNLKNETKISLTLYSGNLLSRKMKLDISNNEFVFFKGSLPYKKLIEEQKKYDVFVHVEANDYKNYLVTRLSFSTKIIDYMINQKPILCIGRKGSATLDYLQENKAAIVCYGRADLEKNLSLFGDVSRMDKIISNASILIEKKHSILLNSKSIERKSRLYNENSTN